ncbi:uncharacterized protein N7503_006503 [Penicillium pulvis]|uniref:uncharacterized protein n=1 Tax=Penicillium pulvis TaxID=1562058 RepID=UPI002548906D|nr:uncharacterized protein N7503_006503 [Penicillium pulvis]KAJ5798998.1 hypothetical protein N7503_006503 [Penicillium pulvis]
MFDPDLILRAAPVADFQAAYFMMDISLPGNRLPNDLAVLNPFLEGLSSHYFYIYILEENGENGRSIKLSICYTHYIWNPSTRLHAKFTVVDSFVIYYSSTTEQRSRKRIRMDFTP